MGSLDRNVAIIPPFFCLFHTRKYTHIVNQQCSQQYEFPSARVIVKDTDQLHSSSTIIHPTTEPTPWCDLLACRHHLPCQYVSHQTSSPHSLFVWTSRFVRCAACALVLACACRCLILYLYTPQRQFSTRSERVKGVDLHPTEPWCACLVLQYCGGYRWVS